MRSCGYTYDPAVILTTQAQRVSTVVRRLKTQYNVDLQGARETEIVYCCPGPSLMSDSRSVNLSRRKRCRLAGLVRGQVGAKPRIKPFVAFVDTESGRVLFGPDPRDIK